MRNITPTLLKGWRCNWRGPHEAPALQPILIRSQHRLPAALLHVLNDQVLEFQHSFDLARPCLSICIREMRKIGLVRKHAPLKP